MVLTRTIYLNIDLTTLHSNSNEIIKSDFFTIPKINKFTQAIKKYTRNDWGF